MSYHIYSDYGDYDKDDWFAGYSCQKQTFKNNVTFSWITSYVYIPTQIHVLIAVGKNCISQSHSKSKGLFGKHACNTMGKIEVS